MIISQYKETCEVLLYYPTIGGEDKRNNLKNSIRNILRAIIYVYSRRLIAEFPVNGVKCISKPQSHCENTNFDPEASPKNYNKSKIAAPRMSLRAGLSYLNNSTKADKCLKNISTAVAILDVLSSSLDPLE